MQLPGFEIIEVIGQGGMASVWKARQLSLDRLVAIKFLSARLAGDQADVQRFQAEAQAAAKLKHSGIVQVYDAHAEPGLYYFVMEYVAGETIGQWVRRKGIMSEKDALQIAECVADALAYAWNKERIIHCDIKPDNVMVDADGTVKVADLGLARTIHAMSAAAADAEIMGTPSYISPEQARGDANLDFRADIYSLGAMLYHLVTGHMPFDGNPPEQIMDLQITGHLKDPFDLNPKLSRGICSLIEKMMWKSPDGRHGSWESVVEDIKLINRRHIPKLTIGATGKSTVLRSVKRTTAQSRSSYASRGQDGESSFMGGLGWVLVAIVLLVIAAAILSSLRSSPPPPVVTVPLPAAAPASPAAAQPDGGNEAARRQYDELMAWVRSHPSEKAEAVRRLSIFSSRASRTPYAELARGEARRLQDEMQAGTDGVMQDLSRSAARLIASSQYLEAARLYENYAGPLAPATASMRAEKAAELRRNAELHYVDQLRESLRKQRSLADLRERIAVALLQGNSLARAADTVRAAASNSTFAAQGPSLQRLGAVLESAQKMDERILRSFEADQGRDVTVALASGTSKLTIENVADGKISALETRNIGGAAASLRVVFTVADLSVRERLQRMGADDDPCAALLKGMTSWSGRMYAAARKYFEATDPFIAGRLVEKVREAEAGLAPVL